uniref:H1.10 linker histone n=1 Tax=Bos taurus TaxID=9913 RepID=F1MMU4_BOVIN
RALPGRGPPLHRAAGSGPVQGALRRARRCRGGRVWEASGRGRGSKKHKLAPAPDQAVVVLNVVRRGAIKGERSALPARAQRARPASSGVGSGGGSLLGRLPGSQTVPAPATSRRTPAFRSLPRQPRLRSRFGTPAPAGPAPTPALPLTTAEGAAKKAAKAGGSAALSPSKKRKNSKKKNQPGKYSQLVVETIRRLGERNGSSLAKIYAEAKKVAWFDQQNGRTYLKYSIKALVQNDTLLQVKGTGANGSFKLNRKKLEGGGGERRGAPAPASAPAPAAHKAKKAAPGAAAPRRADKKPAKGPQPEKRSHKKGAASKKDKGSKAKKAAAAGGKKVKKAAKPSVPKVPKGRK